MTDLLLALDGLRCGALAEAVSPAWLWVRDGRVAHLADHRPPGAAGELELLRGGWAVEPLADAHVHLFLCGSFGEDAREAVAGLERGTALERVLGLLEDYRRSGFAAVRDGGDPKGLALEAAAVANADPGRYATVLPAGEPVHHRGKYGGFLGQGVESVAEAIALLERNLADGATHLKVLTTGINSLDRPGDVGARQFTPAELDLILSAARARGVPTMAHANGPLGWVLGARPDSVEHGFWHEARDRYEMAAAGVAYVPTLGAWEALARHPGLAPQQREVVGATARRHRREVRSAARCGVSLAAGSDAGTPGVRHVDGLLREIELGVAAGLPPTAALASATHGARLLCQRETTRPLGGLTLGQPAGFLWLREDPARDPGTLKRPLGVFLGGRWSPHPLRGRSPQTGVSCEETPTPC